MTRIVAREVLFVNLSILGLVGLSGMYNNYVDHPLMSFAVLVVGMTLHAVSRSFAFLADIEEDKQSKASLVFRAAMYYQSVMFWSLAAKMLFIEVNWMTVTAAVGFLGMAVYYIAASYKTPLPRWMRGPKTWAEIQEEKSAKQH